MMKIAIVHDYLNQYGGAERVVEVLRELFPEAPIYTSIYLPDNMPNSFRKMDIRTSFMQKLPFLHKHFKKYLLLYPKAIQSFDLSKYDVVLSSSSAFAKGAIKGQEACHICYCYTPMRFVWNYEEYVARENFGKCIRKILPFAIQKLRKWDETTVNRVDYFIAISQNIQRRIKEYYDRESEVIYPPVNTEIFQPSKEIGNYFLVVSRLNSYKRIDLVIQVFNELKLPLRIIGNGPHRSALEKMAHQNIKFLGKVSDEKLAENYSKCKALVFPSGEDFGIAPLEAQASGRPVIAYADGGALETIVEGITGIFFKQQTAESLIEAIGRFDKIKNNFVPQKIRENAFRFDKEIFKRKIKIFIEEKYVLS